MSLANTYRPRTWDDVVEQGLTVQILKSVCSDPSLPCRNFLLTGSQGVGKTTLSKIAARSLNGGEDGEIIEVDAATNGTAEAIRELTQQAKTYPLSGNVKTIILDECHALSSAAWSALLSTIENQPARTCWFFCTTNPEKIPKTILSRVQQFQLSKISLQGIIDRMKYVLDQEIAKGSKISYTDDGVAFIAKLANGGLRDALTLLDKTLMYSRDITTESVTASLVMFDYNDFFDMLSAVAKHDNEKIAEVIDRVYNSGTNFVKWFDDLHSFVLNVAKYIVVRDINRTMIPSHYADKLSKYTMSHYTVCLRLANVLISLCQELRTTNYQQEVALTRLLSVPKKEVKQ